ncbi:HAD family hydrolase [Spongiibacter sp.]|uniref:HAD family hydrolase n=1 Tax=Spongiibacter sp. TaxID=2024860 RepID=UPI0035613D91
MSRIRAISFDLDDTLWPSGPVLEAAEGIFYQQLESLAPRLVARYSAQALRQQRLALLREQPALRHQISEWRRLSLEIALRDCGYGEQSQRLAATAFQHFIEARQQVQLYDHVESVLAELSTHYVLVSLTNGNADLLRQPCSRHFRACLKAEDIGTSKPEAAAFHAALAAADCSAEELLHIGDHPRDDIDGAKALGLKTVQALMPGSERPRHLGADGHFSDWRELPALLRQLDQDV